MPDPTALYKSPAGYAAMMAWYDQALAELRVPVESLSVLTRYGVTHAVAAGPLGAPPVVLLHAVSANALLWAPQIPALARDYRVYALDVIGMAGRSAPVRLPYDGRSYADWLRQALDALGLAAASFVGLGFGAWLILRLAGLAPHAITRAALLSPAGFLPVHWKYLVPVIWDVLFINDDQARRLSRQLLAPPDVPLDERLTELLFLSIKHFQPVFEAPGLPAAQIAQLTAPTLVLVGEHEGLWSPRELLGRARFTLPHLRAAEVVPGAGHGLTVSHADFVNARLRRFLREDA